MAGAYSYPDPVPHKAALMIRRREKILEFMSRGTPDIRRTAKVLGLDERDVLEDVKVLIKRGQLRVVTL